MEKLIIAGIAAAAGLWLFGHIRRNAKSGKCSCGTCTGSCGGGHAGHDGKNAKAAAFAAICSTLCLAAAPGATFAQQQDAQPSAANAAATAQTAPVSPVSAVADMVDISGLIEIEASLADSDESSESDITLATVEIALGAQINPWLRADAVFLYEEDDTDPPELDIAVISLGDIEASPFYAQAGKMYVPFGNYESFFVSDPITLEIGETQATALLAGAALYGFDFSVSCFNSDVEDGTEDDHIDNFVLSLDWQGGMDGLALAAGASYIYNMADSAGLVDAVGDSASAMLEDPVGGLSAWLRAEWSGFTLGAEYLAAADDFEPGTLSFDGAGNDWNESARPSALNLELGYAATDRLTVAAKYETARDTFDWMPETRCGAAATFVAWEDEGGRSLSLALEYLHSQYDAEGDPEEDGAVFQTALSF